MLDTFETGWRNTFTPYVEYVLQLFPNVRVESVERYKGMLRMKLLGDTPEIQYILDGFSYKLERDSAKLCEKCGKYGIRRSEEYLSEMQCLCITCYVHTVDSILNNN